MSTLAWKNMQLLTVLVLKPTGLVLHFEVAAVTEAPRRARCDANHAELVFCLSCRTKKDPRVKQLKMDFSN